MDQLDTVPTGCPEGDYTAYVENSDGTCYGVKNPHTWTNYDATDLYSGNSLSGMQVHYKGDDSANDLYLNIMCSADVADNFVFTGASNNTLNFVSSLGCPVFRYDTLTVFLSKYSYLLGALMIAGGLFLNLKGNQFVNFVIGFVGFLAASVIFLELSFYGLASEDVQTEEWILWTILVVCLIAGGLVGALLVKARKIGLAILAAWGGVTLGLLLTTTIVIENTYAFYGLIVLCAVVCFYAAYKTERYVIMIASAHIGAYLFVRGISLYAGGFPSEASLHSEI